MANGGHPKTGPKPKGTKPSGHAGTKQSKAVKKT